jgi:hypothetical protein
MLIRRHFISLALAVSPLLCGAAPVDFAREIRPMFSENCFACHGPDSNKRKAGLRLDQKESAFGKAESGEIAIVPGDVEKSELLRRVSSTDKDEVMPPPKEHKVLKPEQIELLRRWIWRRELDGALPAGEGADIPNIQHPTSNALQLLTDSWARLGARRWKRGEGGSGCCGACRKISRDCLDDQG